MFDRRPPPIDQESPRQRVYACLCAPRTPSACEGASAARTAAGDPAALVEVAQAFSPRYERHGDHLVTIDVSGLDRLMRSRGTRGAPTEPTRHSEPREHREHPRLEHANCPENLDLIAQELLRATIEKQSRAHVAVAGTRVAALVLAHARPGVTVISPGQEAVALASVPVEVLVQVADWALPVSRVGSDPRASTAEAVSTFTRWSLRTLGELARLPAAQLTARLGRQALRWQAVARGEDIRPLVPTELEERFEGTLELEWPIDGLEPLSFVLTRLLEPLSTQLERRDRGAAVLHVLLDLVTREVHARHLQLPTPIRDVRTLRTLALLDIESHPPAGAIDRVTVVIEPTPGRIVQHTLFARALPTPERLATLLARVSAVMGSDRVGAPGCVDTYRPGAFAMVPFSTAPSTPPASVAQDRPATRPGGLSQDMAVMALRRCRQPVPARVVVELGRPLRVTSDRRGFPGGSVTTADGPWRTSGHWWDEALSSVPTAAAPWHRDEWDVSLSDGARYRIFRDRTTDAWFVDGIFD